MTDTVTTYPPPYSLVIDLSKNQTVENIAHEEPQPLGSSLHYVSNTDKVQYKTQSGLRNNADNTSPLVNAPLNATGSTDSIEAHKVWSIFNILCCQLCLGCIACHYSMKTRTLKKHGDIQGAIKASKQARNMNIAATVCGIFCILLYFLISSFSQPYASGAH
jgi:hypothetical protein